MGPSDYVLLELLERLGGVQGRKKLQKLAFIAKLEGLPLEDEFFFHYYGPYSSGLASRVDHLVEAKLLEETARPLAVAQGEEYSYKTTDDAQAFLAKVRPSVPSAFREAMERGINRAVALKDRDVFPLELASTLLYWRNQGHSFEEAEAITRQRKNADPSSSVFKEARKIAEEVWKTRRPSEE